MARIIIADDTAILRDMLRSIIEQMGHQVVAEASTGEQAVAAYARHKPDLATMDITMPDMDGITAVRLILASDPAARIVMCSAIGLHHTVLKAISAGAKDFIVKPFQKDRVAEAINGALQRS